MALNKEGHNYVHACMYICGFKKNQSKFWRNITIEENHTCMENRDRYGCFDLKVQSLIGLYLPNPGT
jgi:hypothetical protein